MFVSFLIWGVHIIEIIFSTNETKKTTKEAKLDYWKLELGMLSVANWLFMQKKKLSQCSKEIDPNVYEYCILKL